jgi:hypothetical protein
MELNKVKIKILNKKHSKQVQMALFEKGIGWSGGLLKKYQNWDIHWIFIENNDLSHSGYFYGEESPYKEITLEDILSTYDIQYEIY